MSQQQQQQQQQSTTFLARLAFEMLYVIADDLSARDQKNCTLVCREWHTLFRRILFSVIDANTRAKFDAFRAALRSASSTGEQIGLYARKLIIRDGYMTVDEMEELKQHCPNLRHLTFLYEDNAAHDKIIKWLKENGIVRGNRKVFGVPRQLVETLPVSSLTMECDEKKRRTTGPDASVDYCKIYLAGCSNLHTLTLTRVFREISLELIDKIHSNCPNLTTLQIETCHDDDEAPAMFEADKKFVDNLLKNHCDVKRLRRLCLKPLAIDSFRALCWLQYVTFQYPDLESLTINGVDDIPSASAPTVEETKEICASLAEKCPRLHTVSFKSIYLCVDLFRVFLSKGHYLRHYAFTDIPLHQSKDELLLGYDASHQQLLLSLSLCIKEELNDNYFVLLRASSQLTKLELYGKGAFPRFPLCDLLSTCSRLQCLTLSLFNLRSENENNQESTDQEGTSTQSALCTLELFDCSVDWHVTEYIAAHCPNLKQLRLHNIDYAEKDRHPIVRLHFPNHHLRNVIICSPEVKYAPSQVDGPVRLVSLHLEDSTELLANAPYADSNAVWFSLCRKAMKRSRRAFGTKWYGAKCCGQDYEVDGHACPVKCRIIRKPEIIDMICKKINALLRGEQVLTFDRNFLDPPNVNNEWPENRDWRPAASIDYFGYLSLRFASVENLVINGNIKVVIKGRLQDRRYISL